MDCTLLNPGPNESFLLFIGVVRDFVMKKERVTNAEDGWDNSHELLKTDPDPHATETTLMQTESLS